MTETEITRVTYRWTDQTGVTPGWYCETWSGSQMVDESQKVWFPVDVEDFLKEEEAQLVESLREAFPEAEIIKI
jgi:hypothetical protein